MAEHQPGVSSLTFDEAVGRIFAHKDQRFYVARGIHLRYSPHQFVRSLPSSTKCFRCGEDRDYHTQLMYECVVIDLETSQQVLIYDNAPTTLIPSEWKEILP